MILNTTYDYPKRTARVSLSSLEGEMVITVILVDIKNDEPDFDMLMETKNPLRLWDMRDFDTMRSLVAKARLDLVRAVTI